MPRALAALLAVAALFAVPATALGQSAGDEQYVDPFQGGEEQPSQAPQEAPQEVPAQPTEPVPAAPATPPAEGGEVTPAPAQTEAPTLPRTGLPVLLLLCAGYALLLAGAALRRTL